MFSLISTIHDLIFYCPDSTDKKIDEHKIKNTNYLKMDNIIGADRLLFDHRTRHFITRNCHVVDFFAPFL